MSVFTRRQVLRVFAVGAFSGGAIPRGNAQPEQGITWHDVRDWGVEGKGWSDTASPFDRLPARAEGVVPSDVWRQSRHSAGMIVRFRTAAREIWTDHVVGSEGLSTPDLAAIAHSGLDLYATDSQGQWKWVSVTRPRSRLMRGPMISGLMEGERDYQLYLPLYNSTQALKIGVPSGDILTPISPRQEKPLLFYGTSITQGASASRAGRCHTAILGRQLNLPVLNLGFGGAGRMEPEVGRFLAELDPAIFVIDCLPNMQAAQVSARAVPLVRQIRNRHPSTPIVLVEDRTYSNSLFLPARQQEQQANRAALQQAFADLKSMGEERLWYIEGAQLLGEDQEGTSDSSHPTDLGFWRQANIFEPILKAALNREAAS